MLASFGATDAALVAGALLLFAAPRLFPRLARHDLDTMLLVGVATLFAAVFPIPGGIHLLAMFAFGGAVFTLTAGVLWRSMATKKGAHSPFLFQGMFLFVLSVFLVAISATMLAVAAGYAYDTAPRLTIVGGLVLAYCIAIALDRQRATAPTNPG